MDFGPSTLAGIITATASVFTAIGGLLLAFGVLIPVLRTARITNTKVDAVHVLVNSQHTDLVRYQRALVSALKHAGIEVPVDQSLDPEANGAAEVI